MKVILLKDIKGTGRAHETITAADGYALNYLLPKKFAVAATPAAAKEAALRRKQSADRIALDAALLTQNLESLAEARIVLRAKANEKNHLYNAIGESDIVKAVKEQINIELPEDALKLQKPIKELGVCTIPVSLGEVFGKFSITVEAE